MAITTYAELKASIADFLNRDDLANAIPSFVSLAEAAMSRQLRLQRMVKRSTATADDGYITLPADWLESINIQVNVSGVPHKISYITHEQADDYMRQRSATSGVPMFYAVTGLQLELVPPPSMPLEAELIYYARVPALSDTNPTNFLLTYWPDLYLYGALIHSAPYLKEDARIAVWAEMYGKTQQELMLSDEQARVSGSALKVRARAFG